MGKFIFFRESEIRKALEDVRRVYFAGDLKRDENLHFIKTDELEIGISSYKKATNEVTHFHTRCNEYQYVLSGYTEYMDVETHEVFSFKKNDFYMIESGTKYAQKAKSGTSILFIKVPSLNDKTLIQDDGITLEFLKNKIESIRKDYFYKHDAPSANSVRPAVSAAIVFKGKLLLLKRKDNKKWTLPGGTIEHNETCEEALIREVKEECNVDIKNIKLFKIYDDPNILIEYLDGEIRREFTLVYVAEPISSIIRLDDESSVFGWFGLEELGDLEFTESQKRRIDDLKKAIFEKNDVNK